MPLKEQRGFTPPQKPKGEITQVDVSTDVDLGAALGGKKIGRLTKIGRGVGYQTNHQTSTDVVIPKR